MKKLYILTFIGMFVLLSAASFQGCTPSEGEKKINLLIKDLKSHDANVHWKALKALEKIGEPSIKPLIKALKEKNSAYRVVVASALGDVLRRIRPKQSKPGEKAIIKALKDEFFLVRAAAAEALGKIESERLVNPLIEALNDEVVIVQMAASESLGNIGSKKAVVSLIEILKSKNSDLRLEVVMALEKIRSLAVVDPLIHVALNDKNVDIRIRAIFSLGEIRSKRAVDPLIKVLEDKEDRVRESAAFALSHIHTSKALKAVEAYSAKKKE